MAKKSKFLMVSLQDEQSKHLAQVLANPTARKILEHLADKADTEAAIAKTLGIAISTVHYNLNQLVKGGLVESEEFHYSKKGREVKHYKLANQYILIAPKSTFGLKEKLKGLLPSVGILGGVSFALSYFSKTTQLDYLPMDALPVQSVAQVAPRAAPMAARSVPTTVESAPLAKEAAESAVVQSLDESAGASADMAIESVAESSAEAFTEPVAQALYTTPIVEQSSFLTGLDVGLLVFITGALALLLHLGIQYIRFRSRNY